MKTVSLKAMVLFLLLFAASAMAQGTFYFLPPNDPDWIRKTPHILDMDAGTMRKMDLESTACGWYRTAITSAEASHNIVIWQGKGKIDATTDRIGLLGLDEGEADWTGAPLMPTFIGFGERFASLGATTIYFDPSKGIEGWGTSNAVMNDIQKNRCNYTMAGIIYDTDKSRMSSFTTYDGSNESWVGIRRGIVKNTLAKDAQGVPKMQWNDKTGVNAAMWSKTDFDKAFRCSPGDNALVCYDMPFTRDNKGLWTFASDYLCADGSLDLKDGYFTAANAVARAGSLCPGSMGGPMLSFAPNILNSDRGNASHLGQPCTYDACSSCYTTYSGSEPVTPFNNDVDTGCYEKGRTGTGNCGAVFADGQLGDGENPSIWNWGERDKIRSSMVNRTLNSFFCFESHADFTYEKGQQFYFSGDDDIWVFINNNLVLDLGGSHLASASYVDLDSIGVGGRWQSMGTALKEDSTYAIDIFFCDRRTNASNIRITTNMYISQKNGLFVQSGTGTTSTANICLTQEGGGNCAALLSGGGVGTQQLCGEKTNGFIEFYIINRRGEPESKQVLSLNIPECRAGSTAGEIICYGGITVNTNNGTARVDKGKLVGLPGSWSLYAKVVDSKAAAMNPPPEDVKIASFSSAVAVRMAWGTIREGSAGGKVILDPICRQNPVATTGEYVPICFSAGDISGSNFVIDFVADIVGSPFSLNTAGFTNNAGGKLKIYEDNGSGGPNMEKPVNFATALEIPRSGVLVLWVTGDYAQGEWEFGYDINVKNRSDVEKVTLRSVVPRLAWIPALGSTTEIPASQQKGAKRNANWEPIIGGDDDYELKGYTMPEWIGVPIPLYLMAYRMDGATVVPCKTCAFDIFVDAEATGLEWRGSQLVNGTNLTIKNGEANIFISGAKPVMPPDNHAKITVKGEHNPDLQQATWTDLHFQEPPVPYPETATLFDRNGDGIGDSLVIIYNRGFRRDSLPNMIEVLWEKDTTAAVRYGIASRTLFQGDSVYAFEGLPPAGADSVAKRTRNLEFWKTYLHLSKVNPALATLEARSGASDADVKVLKDTIILSKAPDSEEDASFSREVLTKSVSGIARSWASFCTGEGCDGSGKQRRDYNTPLSAGIEDSIPAIIIAASYIPGEASGCGGRDYPCQDKITLEFSEPVKVDEAASASPEEARNPFAYMLRDIGEGEWKVLGGEFLPTSMNFRPSGSSIRPSSEGDSIVSLVFNRYRGENANSKTPMPGDSVKFAGNRWGATANAFVDANGNKPNPREIGRQIEGRKPFTPEKIPIGDVDPNNPDYAKETAKDVVKEICRENGGCSPELEDRLKDLFGKGKPAEILPVPPYWSAKDAQNNYGGTVGILLNPDIFNEIADLENTLGVIPDSTISIRAKVFYHTNLGNYVADRAIAIRCDDPIFPISPSTGKPSCKDSRSKLYIAWDMKDSKGRLVGTGAYVGLYDFYWEINYPGVVTNLKKAKIERKVEMHGVKRTKKK